MKITKETVEAMREHIAPLDTDERRSAYREGRFPRAEAVKDLDTRYRWDLYHASRCVDVIKGDGDYPQDLTTNHIDTALRRIVQPLGK